MKLKESTLKKIIKKIILEKKKLEKKLTEKEMVEYSSKYDEDDDNIIPPLGRFKDSMGSEFWDHPVTNRSDV
jgi:hypothetical protein